MTRQARLRAANVVTATATTTTALFSQSTLSSITNTTSTYSASSNNSISITNSTKNSTFTINVNQSEESNDDLSDEKSDQDIDNMTKLVDHLTFNVKNDEFISRDQLDLRSFNWVVWTD